MKKTPESEKHWRLVGASLSAALFGYTIIYFTSSKLSIAHEIGWLLIGLNVAYVRVTISEVSGKIASIYQESGNGTQSATH